MPSIPYPDEPPYSLTTLTSNLVLYSTQGPPQAMLFNGDMRDLGLAMPVDAILTSPHRGSPSLTPKGEVGAY